MVKTSFSALIALYKQSDLWLGLKPRTKQTYQRVLSYLEEKNGDKDVTKVTPQDVNKARDANKNRPRFANNVIAVLSILFKVAMEEGWVANNPAAGVRKLKIPKDRKKPHVPWTDEALDVFRKNAGRRELLVLELGIGSVQRPGDLVKFKWGDYDGEALDVTQGKSEKRLWLPCSTPLKRALDEERKLLGGSPHPASPILRGKKGGRLTDRLIYRKPPAGAA